MYALYIESCVAEFHRFNINNRVLLQPYSSEYIGDDAVSVMHLDGGFIEVKMIEVDNGHNFTLRFGGVPYIVDGINWVTEGKFDVEVGENVWFPSAHLWLTVIHDSVNERRSYQQGKLHF